MIKDCIARGSVTDMAVGIIIGVAFTAIVKSLAGDLINPTIGLFAGGLDFSALGIALGEGDDAGVFAYGKFIMAVINFLIVAWVVFLLVNGVNRVKTVAEKPAKPPVPDAPKGPAQEELLTEIRDLLKT